MFRILVKSEAVAVDDQRVPVRYFELRTVRGLRRYSAEIWLSSGDRIILDDDSVTNLEARAARLVPATIYSRALAGTGSLSPHIGAATADIRVRRTALGRLS